MPDAIVGQAEGPPCGLRQEVTVGGFTIKEFVLNRRYTRPAHAHAVSGIVIGRDGSYTADFDGVRCRVGSGDALVLPAGMIHRELVGEHGAHCYLVEPEVGRRRQLQRAGMCVDSRQWRHNPALKTLSSRLATWIAASDAVSRLVLESVVLEILAVLARASNDSSSRIPGWLVQTWARAQEEPQRWSVQRLADRAGVTPEHLSRRFRAAYGLPVSECLRSNRLALAAERVRKHG